MDRPVFGTTSAEKILLQNDGGSSVGMSCWTAEPIFQSEVKMVGMLCCVLRMDCSFESRRGRPDSAVLRASRTAWNMAGNNHSGCEESTFRSLLQQFIAVMESLNCFFENNTTTPLDAMLIWVTDFDCRSNAFAQETIRRHLVQRNPVALLCWRRYHAGALSFQVLELKAQIPDFPMGTSRASGNLAGAVALLAGEKSNGGRTPSWNCPAPSAPQVFLNPDQRNIQSLLVLKT